MINTVLRTAVEKGEGSLDKEATSHDDCFDAFRLSLRWWETNATDDTPVMRMSTDNGATFGPVLTLATNGTLGEASEGEEEG